MTNNAMWWVNYTDAKTDRGGMLSLMSPDLANVKLARKRAMTTAKTRLAKKGIKAVVTNVRCVG